MELYVESGKNQAEYYPGKEGSQIVVIAMN